MQQEISAAPPNLKFNENPSGESRPDTCGITNVSKVKFVV